jgi:repressor LexA
MPIVGTYVKRKCAQVVLCTEMPELGTVRHMANNLKSLREAREWSQEHLAALMGTTRNQYVKLESGKRRLSDVWIGRAAEALGVDSGEIVSSHENAVPVMGYVGAGAHVEPEFEQVPEDGLDKIVLPFAVPREIIAFVIRGESMRPAYRDGDAILVWREQRFPTEHFVGEEAAVRTADGRRFLKEIQKGEGRSFNLYSHNDVLIQGVRIAWVGEIYLIVKAGQIRRLERSARAASARRASARAAKTKGMGQLDLTKVGS